MKLGRNFVSFFFFIYIYIFFQTLPLFLLLIIGLRSRHIKEKKIQRLYCTHHKIRGNLREQQIQSPNHVFVLAHMKNKVITCWIFSSLTTQSLTISAPHPTDWLSGHIPKQIIGFC